MSFKLAPFALALAVFSFGSSALGADLTGKVQFESKRRLNHLSEAEIAVVFYRPANNLVKAASPVTSPKLAERNASEKDKAEMDAVEMRMSMKQFQPTVVAVQTGTNVHFPNADRVIHNAFSTTKNNEFDLGLYSQGESKTHRFDEPGLVKVFCNVHQNMYGYVMVLDTPHFTRLRADGSFELNDLPNGPGKLFIWHPRGKTFSKVLEINDDSQHIETSIALTKRTVPRHKNKFGKPYRRNRDY